MNITKSNKNHPPIRVVLIDDHTLLRETLKEILNDQAGIQVVGEAADRPTGQSLIETIKPTVVIQDICIGKDNGLDMLRHLKTTTPQIKCIVLTGFTEDDFILEAIQNHADGYLLKDCTMPTLIHAIRKVATNHKYWDESILDRLTLITQKSSQTHDREKMDYLSPGEKEISRLVSEGLTNGEIARIVNLAEKTIRNRISLIMDKLHVPRRSKLAALYAEDLMRKKRTL